MGILTSDMKRLRREIRELRGTRKDLMLDLARGAKEMKDVVAGMRANFRNAHTDMARNMRAEREAFVFGLKRSVSGMRKEFADDLAGARRAWLEPTPAKC